jgi:hypothetical protein
MFALAYAPTTKSTAPPPTAGIKHTAVNTKRQRAILGRGALIQILAMFLSTHRLTMHRELVHATWESF